MVRWEGHVPIGTVLKKIDVDVDVGVDFLQMMKKVPPRGLLG